MAFTHKQRKELCEISPFQRKKLGISGALKVTGKNHLTKNNFPLHIMCFKHCIIRTSESSMKKKNHGQITCEGLEPVTFALLEQMSCH